MGTFALTTRDYARLGIWLDDPDNPYGDGQAPPRSCKPPVGLAAAQAEVAGEPWLDGARLIYERYAKRVRATCFTPTGRMRAVCTRYLYGDVA